MSNIHHFRPCTKGHFYLIFFLFISLTLRAQRQEEKLFTVSFHQTPIKTFIAAIENQSEYKFFLDIKQFDSVQVNVEVVNAPLREILTMAFDKTEYHFAIGASHQVYLIKGKEFTESIPLPGQNGVAANPSNKALRNFLNDEKKAKANIFAENKQYDIGTRTVGFENGTATISGYIKSSNNGEPIIGAIVMIEQSSIGVSTNQFGYYTLTLPKGKHLLKIKSLGMNATVRNINLYGDGKLDIELVEAVTALKEVVVEASKDRNLHEMQMGLEKLDIKMMKKIPVALGEVDVLKAMLALPGVQTVGEATTGLNVRGGATNQNLILFNDATIYNPSHLFGFFSAFNPDIIKNAELYKSGIPANYGGRLSSVLDITSRDGNKKKLSGGGGIGPVTSRISLEGPILKDRSSFLLGARTSYSNWLLKQIPNDAISHSRASFYDLNANVNHEFSEKNSVSLTAYYSNDAFTLNGDSTFKYSNRAASGKWKHSFNPKLLSVTTVGFTGYQYQIQSDKKPVNAFDLKYEIKQTSAKTDFSYFPNSKHNVNFGLSAIDYHLSPGSITPKGTSSEITRDVVEAERGIESAAYIGDNYDVTQALSIYAGLRYSNYQYLGPHTQYTYQANASRSSSTVTDTIQYKSGKAIANYGGPEYRLAIKYAITNSASLKVSYNKTRQYIQMLSVTSAIAPTDIWKLSDRYIKPQVGDQISLGFYKNLRHNTIEASIEGYYRTMQNSIDYKGGAKIVLNHTLETDLINAMGKAYGVEFLIRKSNGKLNGWFSYTYSRSLLQTKSAYASETVNDGKYYPSNYDKPHAVNLISNYKFSHRFSTSLNVTYSTGRPMTVPVGKYYADGSYKLFYGPRNSERIPDYFRIDLSLNIEGNHRIKKLAHSSWTVGLYNLTGRKNAYSVFYSTNNGVISGHKLSIFGNPIPTVTYNYRF